MLEGTWPTPPFQIRRTSRTLRRDRGGNEGDLMPTTTDLPYLDTLVFAIVPNADAQAVRFQSGEADVTTRLSASGV